MRHTVIPSEDVTLSRKPEVRTTPSKDDWATPIDNMHEKFVKVRQCD